MKNHPSLTRMQQQAIYLDGYKGIRNNVKDHQQTFRIYDTLTDPTESEDLTQLPEWDHRYSYFYDLEQRMKDEVLRLRMPHQLAKRAYDNELIAALDHQKLGPTRLYHFQGTWPWVPKFDKNKAHSSEIVNNIGHGHLLRDRNAGLYYEGTINIPKSGRWHFDTNSDQDTVLKIHNCLVVDNKSSKGSLMLEAGIHPFKLSYRRGMTASNLSLSWQGPEVSKQIIPASALKGNL